MPRQKRNRPIDLVPLLILAAAILLALAGWQLFPRLQTFMSYQDCVATGRTNCVPAQMAPAR